jgi:hypothetical protein
MSTSTSNDEPALTIAIRLATDPNIDFDQLPADLANQPLLAGEVADWLLYFAEDAHRLQENSYDEGVLEDALDLMDEALETTVLNPDDQLEFLGVALAVTAARSGLYCSSHLLGDLERPARLFRALLSLLKLRVRRYAEWSSQSEEAALRLVITEATRP